MSYEIIICCSYIHSYIVANKGRDNVVFELILSCCHIKINGQKKSEMALRTTKGQQRGESIANPATHCL